MLSPKHAVLLILAGISCCFKDRSLPLSLACLQPPGVIQFSSLTLSPARIPVCFRAPSRTQPGFVSSLVPPCFCAFLKKCLFCFDHPLSSPHRGLHHPSKNQLRHQFLWLISPAVVLQPRAGPFYPAHSLTSSPSLQPTPLNRNYRAGAL